MIRVSIAAPRNSSGKEPTVEVLVPALPRVGDYVSHDDSGIGGTVRKIQFWWPEGVSEPQIEVRVS